MTTETVSTQLNDVDIEAVGKLVEHVRENPAAAKSTWAAHVTWNRAFASQAKIRTFDPIASDEPASLGGGDTAPNPVEQLLGALGNCLAVGYAANATALGIELKDLKVDVKGDVDLTVFLGLGEGHAGFGAVSAKVTVDSDAPREKLEELHAKVVASSPVGHTIGAAVPVDITLA